ncbi:hypothetical protein Tco_0643817 [Tanacetum coccineum]
MESLNSNSQERELHQLQQMQDKAKESCMASFRLLHSLLKVLSIKGGFERACVALFDQDNQTFTRSLLLNLDNLENKEEFQEIRSFNAFRKSIEKRAQHKREYDRKVNERHMQSKEGKFGWSKALDVGLVVKECSGTKSDKQVTSSSLGNYITHVVDANIRPVNDQVPFAKVQLTAQHNVPANEQHHFVNKAKIKKEIEVLETINIELEHSVAKLLAENEKLNKENEHLKQTYKDLFDSIKKTSVQTKDHADSLIVQLNCKSVENADLKAQIQEKFASQVDVNNVLSKPVTFYYLPKVRESVFVKPHHVIASGSSRNSSKESYGSNDMAYNYYLEEAKKKTQDKNRNLKPREMPSARTHHTPNACTPKPRSYNQTSRNWPVSKSSEETLKAVQKADHSRNPSSFSDSKHFVCLTCQKCVFNANHDACITKFLKEVNSRVRVQSPKTRNSNKPVEPKIHTQKPSRQIVIGHRFSPNKSSVVHEKINTPRSCLRWIPTGRIFNTIGLRNQGFQEFMYNEQGQWLLITSDQHPCFMIMASVDNTAGPVPQRKERCTFQCALSSKEEKSSCILRTFFQARSSKKERCRFSALLSSKEGNLLVFLNLSLSILQTQFSNMYAISFADSEVSKPARGRSRCILDSVLSLLLRLASFVF